MAEEARQSAFLTALTTEHFVLQTVASSTISDAAARSSLYVLALVQFGRRDGIHVAVA